MNKLNSIAVAFAAGSGGGLATILTVWFCGLIGLTTAFGVAIRPPLASAIIYNMVVWGGIFGFLFLLPFMRGSILQRGLLFGLAPSIVKCVIVFPLKDQAGMLGMQLGTLTPVFVLIFNSVWGVVTAWLFVRARGD